MSIEMIDCKEFKRLVLIEPNTKEAGVREHAGVCVDCEKYQSQLIKTDSDIVQSLDVAIPEDLVARLKLAQELELSKTKASGGYRQRYAIAASLIVGVFAAGWLFFASQGLNNAQQQDYQSLLAAVVEHQHKVPMTPVWSSEQANATTQTLLASYDSSVKIKHMDNLRFSRICPMGKYKGLHATTQTDQGLTTFFYIKGLPVNQVSNMSYEGYFTQVKPIKGGNLIIISKTNAALEQTAKELKEALYWDV